MDLLSIIQENIDLSQMDPEIVAIVLGILFVGFRDFYSIFFTSILSIFKK